MAVSAEKWAALILIFFISLFLGISPHFLLPRVKSGNIMAKTGYHIFVTILSCFGAGVLLTTAAMHIVAENRVALDCIDSVWESLDHHFPLAEALFLSGFALIYILEEVAHFLLGADAPGHSHDYEQDHPVAMIGRNSLAHRLSIVSGASVMSRARPNLNKRKSMAAIWSNTLQVPTIHTESPDLRRNANQNHVRIDPRGSSISSVSISVPVPQKYEVILEDPTKEEEEDQPLTCSDHVKNLLAVVALSFHAVMEGIAVGVEQSWNIWFMFGAVALHKFVISLCMGMELCASEAQLYTICTSVFLYAILTPIGVWIGSVMATQDGPNGIAVSLLQGLAGGTILYVVFFEILSRERERKHGNLKKARLTGFIQFLSVVTGLVVMAALFYGIEHEYVDDPCYRENRESDDDHRVLMGLRV